jgi:hypothetical protein
MKKGFLLLAVTLSVGITMNAQNISGHYTIQSKETVDGNTYLNAIAQEITVMQTKDSIKIMRVTPTGSDKTTTTEVLPLNGKEIITKTPSGRQRIASISLNNAKNSAIITTILNYADKPGEIEFKNTEAWSIGSDGTLTIIKTSDATETDDWTIKAVFKKDKK